MTAASELKVSLMSPALLKAAQLTLIQDRIISRAGRVSPVKHQRPISLTFDPEFPAPRTRTEVEFAIDANGRAREETFVDEEEPKTTRGGPTTNEEWELSQYKSSSGDKPILLKYGDIKEQVCAGS
jgi:hypothetical protein